MPAPSRSGGHGLGRARRRCGGSFADEELSAAALLNMALMAGALERNADLAPAVGRALRSAESARARRQAAALAHQDAGQG